jgi:hypothetical protein
MYKRLLDFSSKVGIPLLAITGRPFNKQYGSLLLNCFQYILGNRSVRCNGRDAEVIWRMRAASNRLFDDLWIAIVVTSWSL